MIDDCNSCNYCTPKEQEQTPNKEPHFCKKYEVKLFHSIINGTKHPYKIFPCLSCKGKNDPDHKTGWVIVIVPGIAYFDVKEYIITREDDEHYYLAFGCSEEAVNKTDIYATKEMAESKLSFLLNKNKENNQ